MPLRLRDDLHWCNCAGRAVFLDVVEDRYFCLPQAANEAFLRLADEAVGPGDVGRLQMLVDRGMLVESKAPSPFQKPPSIDAPDSDLIQPPYPRAPALRILRAFAAELSASKALRARPFKALIDDARRRPLARVNTHPARSLAEIAAASAAASLITRSHDRCLVRALAVHALCRNSGFDAKLVFGVIAHPFAAHCWVQLGSIVIVGGYEQARLYTPILVIE